MAFNSISLLRLGLLRPSQMFDSVREQPGKTWLLAFLMVLLPAVVWAHYFQAMETIILGPTNTQSTAQYAVKTLLSVLGSTFSVFALVLLHAIYLALTCRVDPVNRYPFPLWLAFAICSLFPAFIGDVIVYLHFVFSPLNIEPHQLNILSLNAVLFDLLPDHHWYPMTSSVNLLLPWQILLTWLGIQRWTAIGPIHAFVIAAMPYVLTYMLWSAAWCMI